MYQYIYSVLGVAGIGQWGVGLSVVNSASISVDGTEAVLFFNLLVGLH